MSFLYNSFNGLWNKAASYFPGTEKYCADNNISVTTTSNLAKEVGTVAVLLPLIAADAVGNTVMNAAIGAGSTASALALDAKDSMMNAAYSALKSAHTWQFGVTANADKSDTLVGKNSSTMVAELAGAAGAKVLDLGYAALKSTYAWQFETTGNALAEKSSAAMVVELAGAAGAKVLDLGYAALTNTYAALSNNVLPSETLGQDDATQSAANAALPLAKPADAPLPHSCLDIAHNALLPSSALILVIPDDSSENDFSDDSDGDDAFSQPGQDLPASYSYSTMEYEPMDCSDAWSMVNHFGASTAVPVC